MQFKEVVKMKAYKLCSTKLLALMSFAVLITAMYHTLIFYMSEQLTGDNIIRLYEVTLNTYKWIFGIFVAGNIVSKVKKVDKNGCKDEKVSV